MIEEEEKDNAQAKVAEKEDDAQVSISDAETEIDDEGCGTALLHLGEFR